MFGKVKIFFKEVIVESKKVDWPTRRQTIMYTLIVVSISFFVALFLGALDFIFLKFIKLFIF